MDCNDAAAGIFPGAAEVFDNGVDENCDGRDNPNLDVDRDGFARPLDCDDGNAAVRPTAPEIRGNAVDENCDKRAEPFADLGAVVANQWVFGRAFARLSKLVVHNAPRGRARRVALLRAQLPVAAPLRRTVPQRPLARGAAPRLRRARLRPGTQLVVTITAAETDRADLHLRRQARRRRPRARSSAARPGERRGRSC